MSESSERISVSREALRAELTDLKLDLIDRINSALSTKADGSVVNEHDKRITQLELSRATREHMATDLIALTNRVGQLERFRYAWPSAAVLSALAALGLAIYYFAGGH